MKAYCMNCGHPNEYSGAMPKKCEKCKTEFATARVEFKIDLHPSTADNKLTIVPVQALIQDQLEGGEFDSFMEGEPEEVSNEELQNIFLKNSDRGITFKDMVAEAAADIAAGGEKPKIKKRTRRSAPRRKKSK